MRPPRSSLARQLERTATTLALIASGTLLTACHPENQVAKDLTAACEAGDPQSCSDLAIRLLEGRYILQDEPRAAALLDTACKGNVPEGWARLGTLYQNATGVKADSARALFRQGCDGGAMPGCTSLGIRYRQGIGVPQQPERAAELFRQACDGNDMTGCAYLGTHYADGQGVEQNAERAAELFRRACDADDLGGCLGLGRLYASGVGAARNDSLALAILTDACEKTRTQRGVHWCSPRPASCHGAELMPAGQPLLTATDLTKRYGAVTALDGVSFQIHDGVTGILGENGAGKSTAIKILLGLIPPTSGTATLGENVQETSSSARAWPHAGARLLPSTVSAAEFLTHSLGRAWCK